MSGSPTVILWYFMPKVLTAFDLLGELQMANYALTVSVLDDISSAAIFFSIMEKE